jgi:hypothetical protein
MASLEDILNLPDQPTDAHLAALGLLRPPPAPGPTIPKMTPPGSTLPKPLAPYDASKPMVAPMTPRGGSMAEGATTQPIIPKLSPVRAEKGVSIPDSPRGASLAEGATTQPTLPAAAPANLDPLAAAAPVAGAPDLGTGVTPTDTGISGLPPLTKPTAKESIAAGMEQHGNTAKEEGKLQYQEMRPPITAEPGSAEFYKQQVAQAEFDKAHPWGADISAHPGALGKLGHVLGKIGNVALDVAAPATAALIPGTELNKREQERAAEHNEGEAQTRETAADTEKTRELHEENVADLAKQKLEEKEETDKNRDSSSLAKNGLKRDDNGDIIADEKSPIYQAAQQKLKNAEELKTNLLAYKQSATDLNKARTEYEKSKNDPNSPAFQIAMKKLQMAQEAHTIAAKNLELHESEFGNKQTEQELVKPSGQAQSRSAAAQSVLDVMPDLAAMVKKNGAEMGPLMGRINRGEVDIGNVSPDVARLYGP